MLLCNCTLAYLNFHNQLQEFRLKSCGTAIAGAGQPIGFIKVRYSVVQQFGFLVQYLMAFLICWSNINIDSLIAPKVLYIYG
jgi:hypothetical protein